MRRSAAPLLVLVAALPFACNEPPAKAPVDTKFTDGVEPPPVHAPCEDAKIERTRAVRLFADGRLDRTVRVIQRANALCPKDAPESWGILVSSLAELERWEEAGSLASTIEASETASTDAKEAAKKARARIAAFAAPTPMNDVARKLAEEGNAAAVKGDHGVAKEKLLAAWQAAHPNPEALLGAGMATRALGDRIESQRLFDRAAVELERAVGAPLELDVPNGFGGFVNALAWAPNGKTIAVAHRTLVSIVDATTMKEKVRLRGNAGPVTAVAFAPDGRTVATSSRDGAVRIWDVATGREAQRQDHDAAAIAIAWAASGKSLVVATADRTVRAWDLVAGKESSIDVASDEVLSLASSSDGHLVAVGTADHTAAVYQWNGAAWKRVHAFSDHGAAVKALAFSPGAKTLVTGADDRIVRVFDLATGKVVHAMEGHGEKITGLSISADGKTIASSAADQTVRLWDAKTGNPERILDGHEILATSVGFSPDGKSIATGAYNTLHLWDVASGKESSRLEGHASPLAAVSFAPGDSTIATASADRTVRIWSTSIVDEHGVAPRTLVGHDGGVTSIAFTPNGATLASASTDATVRFWDVASGVESFSLGKVGYVHSLAFSPDAKTLAAASIEGSLQLFDVATRKERPTSATKEGAGAYGVAYSPDGKTIALAGTAKAVILRDANGNDLARLTGHGGFVNAVAFSPDGALLASASSDKTVRVWDLASKKEQLRLEGHTDAVLAVAFRNAGNVNLLASGSADGSVRFWDLATGKEVMRLTSHLDPVVSLSMSADGRWLASASKDGTTHLWSLPEAQLRASFRSVNGRDAGYVITPTGQLELFGDARDLPICRAGAVSVPFEACEERFVTPGLLGKVLAGDDRALLP